MAIVGVKFKEDGKIYNFHSDISLSIDDKVIVETERGEQLGIVVDIIDDEGSSKDLKPVNRIATKDDYEKYLNNIADAKTALIETRKIIKKANINMNIISTDYSLDKKHLLFNFVSDERVDFRDLVKDLAAKYHARIELHQIGVRDKAKEIGGIGLCGRMLCCNSCLKDINTVNINMVKNQNIALNPTKINGACGRLLCCFTYENNVYEENRRLLPKLKEKVNYKGKMCEVVELDILNKKYTVKVDENTKEVVNLDD